MPGARSRVALWAAAALACGVAPAAPVPAANAAPGGWRVTLPATSAFDNLSMFADGTAYAAVGAVVAGSGELLPPPVPPAPGGDGSVGYLKSTDHGQTWVGMPPPPVVGGTGTANLWVRFATPLVGYATYSARKAGPGSTGVVDRQLCRTLTHTFRTVDGGRSWSPLCEPRAPRGMVTPVPSPLAVGRDGRTVLLTGEEPAVADCRMPRGVVHMSGDAGATWTRGALPAGYGAGWTARVHDRRTALVIAYKYRTHADCSATGDANAVFLTNDGGRTYRRIFTCARQPLCTAAAFVTRTRIVVGRTDGSTFVTDDGGRRWQTGGFLYDDANDAGMAARPDRRWWHWVQSLSFSDAKHGYASTRGSGTWRTADGGRSWRQELSHECAYYPWGVGENAAATADRALTGGPAAISVRAPTPAGAGPCHPSTGQVPAVTGPVAAAGGLAVAANGTVTR